MFPHGNKAKKGGTVSFQHLQEEEFKNSVDLSANQYQTQSLLKTQMSIIASTFFRSKTCTINNGQTAQEMIQALNVSTGLKSFLRERIEAAVTQHCELSAESQDEEDPMASDNLQVPPDGQSDANQTTRKSDRAPKKRPRKAIDPTHATEKKPKKHKVAKSKEKPQRAFRQYQPRPSISRGNGATTV
jgi:hypothetical protein